MWVVAIEEAVSVTYVQFILLIMPITRPYSIIKNVKNLLVNVKITVSCEQRCLQAIFQQK